MSSKSALSIACVFACPGYDDPVIRPAYCDGTFLGYVVLRQCINAFRLRHVRGTKLPVSDGSKISCLKLCRIEGHLCGASRNKDISWPLHT